MNGLEFILFWGQDKHNLFAPSDTLLLEMHTWKHKSEISEFSGLLFDGG